MTAVIPFLILVLVLVGIAWGFRTMLLAVLAQSAERGHVIAVSMTLARVPVPVSEQFVLSLPARRDGEPLTQLGSFVLTSRRVRLIRRGTVLSDVPLAQIAHLTVQGGALRLTMRGESGPLVIRIAQPTTIARYIRTLAVRSASLGGR
mgnify:CR=1 FL=1